MEYNINELLTISSISSEFELFDVSMEMEMENSIKNMIHLHFQIPSVLLFDDASIEVEVSKFDISVAIYQTK